MNHMNTHSKSKVIRSSKVIWEYKSTYGKLTNPKKQNTLSIIFYDRHYLRVEVNLYKKPLFPITHIMKFILVHGKYYALGKYYVSGIMKNVLGQLLLKLHIRQTPENMTRVANLMLDNNCHMFSVIHVITYEDEQLKVSNL